MTEVSSGHQAWRKQMRADRRRDRVRTVGMLGGFAVLVAGFAVLVLHRWPGEALARACDRQVAALLTSQNPVDVQRAAVLVRELNCDVVHRIAKVETGS